MTSTDPSSPLAAQQRSVLQLRNRKVNRQPVVSPGSGPTADDGVSTVKREKNATDGIRAANLPTRRSDESSPERKGLSGVTPARQGRTGLWSDLEIEELKRLVPSNTDRQGKVSWAQVVAAWISLDLPSRTKAGLSSKWSCLKSKTPILLNPAPTQENSELKKDDELVPHGQPRVSPTKPLDDYSNMRDVNPVVVNELPPNVAKDRTTKVISMTFQKYLKQARMIGCLPNKRKAPHKVSGKHIQPIIAEVNKLIEQRMNSRKGGNLSWDQLSILVYAGALTVSKVGNQRSTEKQLRSKVWFKNTYREVESLRKIIGKATAELNRRKENAEVAPTKQQSNNIRMLKRKHQVETYADIRSLVEKLKCRLQLLQSRIALRKADENRLRVRQTPTKMLLRGIEAKETDETSDVHQIRSFWKSIVGVKKSFSARDPQLVAW